MEIDQHMLDEFITEAKENLSAVERDLLAIESTGYRPPRELIDQIFRGIHSIKGGAGFFALNQVRELSHRMETLLDRMRSGELTPNVPSIDVLLAGTDRILVMLDDVQQSETVDIEPLIRQLDMLLGGPSVAPLASAPIQPTVEQGFIVETSMRKSGERLCIIAVDLFALEEKRELSPMHFLEELLRAGELFDGRLEPSSADLTLGIADRLVYRALLSTRLEPAKLAEATGLLIDEITVLPDEPRGAGEVRSLSTGVPPAETPASTKSDEGEKRVPDSAAQSTASEPTIARATADVGRDSRPPSDAEEDDPQTAAHKTGDRSGTVRISVELLDKLMTFAGELVLVRNQALLAVEDEQGPFRNIVQRLSSVTSGLQEAVILTRMQPVGNLFNKFPRVVRDLGKRLGKEVELITTGNEVELDKTVLENLSDPLTHLVRNACDHGIESPDERRKSGKKPMAKIKLSAYQDGGQIHVEIADDGRGVNPTLVRRKALERGLKTDRELAAISDADVINLILLPGFSTAERVTEFSGRGVGMDVVKTNMEQLGGGLEIASEPGQGTAVRLRVPLTLAIIPCLIVKCGGQRYAIPQKDLEELVCLDGRVAKARIEVAFDQEVYRLRDRLLPMVRLNEVLARPKPFNNVTRAEIVQQHFHSDAHPDVSAPPTCFAVIKLGAERFGLIVDEILNTEEIVVKPMQATMKRLRCFAGSTVMGDGRIALILDVGGIARHAGVSFEAARAKQIVKREEREQESQTVLLFKCGDREQLALALPMIRRIVMIHSEHIERVGEQEFIAIDGVATWVLRLDKLLKVSTCPDSATHFLLLPKHVHRPVGLLVSQVIDTETISIDLNTESYREAGVMGSAIVRGHITLFLDIYRLVEKADPDHPTLALPPPTPATRKVLLVEDTQFFRHLVRGYLSDAGYDVTVADNGQAGLAELDKDDFAFIVSDIEMPIMDGWHLAEAVRKHSRAKHLPMIALTSLSSEKDRLKAKEKGFDRYVQKIDREKFLVAVQEAIDARKEQSR